MSQTSISLKKQIYRCLELIVSILFVQGATFILRPMTWTVLSGKLVNLNPQGVWESVSHLLIFLITVFVLLLLFHSSAGNVPFSFSFKAFIKRSFWLILLVRLGTDILQLALPAVLSLLALPVEAVSQFLIFFLIKKAVCPEKVQHSKWERYALAGGGVALAAIVGWYAFRYFTDAAQMQHIIEKYADPSFLFVADTAGFRLQLISLLFGILLWGTLFLYFGLFRVRSNKTDRDGAKLIAKVLLLCVISFLTIRIKVWISPVGLLGKYRANASEGTTKQLELFDDFTTRTVDRVLNYTESQTVYKQTTVKLRYGNDRIYTFQRQFNREKGHLTAFYVPGVEKAYRYEFDAFAYVDDGRTFVIECGKINNYKKADKLLIRICEQLIREGYFEAFEYSYQYLSRYDGDFIAPYLAQYTAGEFDEDFYRFNADIKREYIAQFAKGIQ